ncbi:thiol:disulfide interchange protein DsbA/DsbL [Kitasatospora arboriphila]|uniref:Thiol:disulfide interchange protein DsbA n=1 Tax=Kitasatospora arboriphila TaxID=258052 RepID=A0ABN1TL29_9ACTN
MKLLRTATALLAATAATAAMAPGATAAAAAPDTPREGAHALLPAHAPHPGHPQRAAAERQEAVEFFWYGCKHCAQFEQPLERWAARHRDDVVLRRVPAVWQGGPDEQRQLGHARLYYTLERLGAVDRLQAEVFRAVRERHEDLTTESGAAAWALAQGLDSAAFHAAWRSPEVDRLVADAPGQMARNRITEIPTVLVGSGRTSPTGAGGVERMPDAMDTLVEHR